MPVSKYFFSQKDCTGRDILLWFPVFTILMLIGGVGGAQQYDAVTLVRLHQSQWEKIHKLDVTYTEREHMTILDIDSSVDASKFSEEEMNKMNVKKVDETWKYHWLSDGKCESLQHLPLPSDSVVDNCYICLKYDGRYYIEDCIVFGQKELIPRSLAESLKNNNRLTLKSQGKIPTELSFPKSTMLGLCFHSTEEAQKIQNLYKFVTSFERQITQPERTIDTNGDILWTFRLYQTLEKGIQRANIDEPYCEITINESKKFFLHCFRVFTPASLSNAKTEGKNVTNMSERLVVGYSESQKGIYFPSKIISGFGPKEVWENRTNLPEEYYTREYNIEEVRINEQVTETPCFGIPQFYVVLREDLMENRPEEDFIPTSIWGKNNEPLVTFMTRKEFNKYMKKVAAYPLPSFGISKIGLFLLVIGMIMTITALIMLYRQRGE